MIGVDEKDIPWIIDDEGNKRYLAAFFTPEKELEDLPKFGNNFDVIPRSEWPKEGREFKHLLLRCQDQKNTNACTGYALAGAIETHNSLMNATPRLFHGGWPYSFANGGRDSGAMCSQVIRAGAQHGFAEESMAPPLSIFQRHFRPEAKENAQRCKIKDYYTCRSFDEIATALLKGFIVYFGIDIGGRFSPDHQGILPPYRRGGGYAGHAMYFFGAPAFKNNKWMIPLRNSWSARWGDNGVAWADESYVHSGRGGEYFAIKIVTTDPQETRIPPIQK